jgi:hypothetical protein
MHDLKKFKQKLYNEISSKIWVKIYTLISIASIHIIWLGSSIFLDYNDKSPIYAFPVYLLIPYIIYVIADSNKDDSRNDNIASEKINLYLNYLISVYFVCIVILILVPDKFEINIINFIKDIFHKILMD